MATGSTDDGIYLPGGATGVLLVHGLCGTPVELRYVARALNRVGHTVYVPRLPGHARGAEDILRTDRRDWFAAVLRGHDRLLAQSERVFAGGLSMGALLALRLAAQRPRQIAGLMLYSTTLFFDGWSVPRGAALLHLLVRSPLARWIALSESFPYGIKDERLRGTILSRMLSGMSGEAGLFVTPGRSLRQLRLLIDEVKRDLPAIHTPTLVLHAAEDDITGPRNAEYLERRLGGQVEKVMLDDCYHMITIDRQRAQVADRSVAFCSRIASTA